MNSSQYGNVPNNNNSSNNNHHHQFPNLDVNELPQYHLGAPTATAATLSSNSYQYSDPSALSSLKRKRSILSDKPYPQTYRQENSSIRLEGAVYNNNGNNGSNSHHQQHGPSNHFQLPSPVNTQNFSSADSAKDTLWSSSDDQSQARNILPWNGASHQMYDNSMSIYGIHSKTVTSSQSLSDHRPYNPLLLHQPNPLYNNNSSGSDATHYDSGTNASNSAATISEKTTGGGGPSVDAYGMPLKYQQHQPSLPLKQQPPLSVLGNGALPHYGETYKRDEHLPHIQKSPPDTAQPKQTNQTFFNNTLDTLSKSIDFHISSNPKSSNIESCVNINHLLSGNTAPSLANLTNNSSNTPSNSNTYPQDKNVSFDTNLSLSNITEIEKTFGINSSTVPPETFNADTSFVVTPLSHNLDKKQRLPSSITKTHIQLSSIDRPKYLDQLDISNTYFELLPSLTLPGIDEENNTLNQSKEGKVDVFLDLTTEKSLIYIPHRNFKKTDLMTLFFRPINDKTDYSSNTVIYYGPNNSSGSNHAGLSLQHILTVRTPLQDTFSSALQYFDPVTNPDAYSYLKLYFDLIYLKGDEHDGEALKNLFNNFCRTPFPAFTSTNLSNQRWFANVLKHNSHIWDVVTELKKQSLIRDAGNNIIEQLSSGIKTIKVCDGLCYAYTSPQYTINNSPLPNVLYKCPRCGSAETIDLEYTSPKLLISHMMGNPMLARLIKTSPSAQTKSLIDNVFESNVVKRLREKGYLKTPYELLFCLSLVNTSVYKTATGVELIQINLILLNLPPSERYLKENMFPIFYLPKFTSNWHNISIDSYFQAIVNDFKDLGSTGFRVYDADVKQWKIMKAYLGFITGDLSSVSLAMGYVYQFGNYPCRVCGAKTCTVDQHHQHVFSRNGVEASGDVCNFQLNADGSSFKADEIFKNNEWYQKFQNLLDVESGKFPADICKVEGLNHRNVFLELDTIFLPDSFPFDFMNFHYSSTCRKILTLAFSTTENCYRRSTLKFSQTIGAHNRFCHVLDFFNRALPSQWLKEKFDYEKILKGSPGALSSAQAKQFLDLFYIIYFEALSDQSNSDGLSLGSDLEDILILEFTLILQISISREITPAMLDFLEISFAHLVKRLERVVTDGYSQGADLSIFSLTVHSIQHIAYYIRKCGNLSSFNSHNLCRSYCDFSDIQDDFLEEANSKRGNKKSIQKIMDLNLQNLAVRLLLPAESHFHTGSCTLVEPRQGYFPINKSWETLSLLEKYQEIESKGDVFATAIFYSKLNRLVWRFFKRNKTFQLCMIDPQTRAVSFPQQNDLFLDPAKCQRFRACEFASTKAQTRIDNVARLKSKDKARYALVHDFVKIRFTVANPDGTNVREMEKGFVLFTELTTQLKKIEVPSRAVDPKNMFPKGTNFGPSSILDSSGKVGLKSNIIYGYYYTFPYCEEEAADYASFGRLYCEPPMEQRWDVAPAESLSNPVYSIPIVSRDQKTVNVHLFDTRYHCELLAGNKHVLIDDCGPENEYNEIYGKASSK